MSCGLAAVVDWRPVAQVFRYRATGKRWLEATVSNPRIPIKFDIYRGEQYLRSETFAEPIIKIGKVASSHLQARGRPRLAHARDDRGDRTR